MDTVPGRPRWPTRGEGCPYVHLNGWSHPSIPSSPLLALWGLLLRRADGPQVCPGPGLGARLSRSRREHQPQTSGPRLPRPAGVETHTGIWGANKRDELHCDRRSSCGPEPPACPRWSSDSLGTCRCRLCGRRREGAAEVTARLGTEHGQGSPPLPAAARSHRLLRSPAGGRHGLGTSLLEK